MLIVLINETTTTGQVAEIGKAIISRSCHHYLPVFATAMKGKENCNADTGCSFAPVNKTSLKSKKLAGQCKLFVAVAYCKSLISTVYAYLYIYVLYYVVYGPQAT